MATIASSASATSSATLTLEEWWLKDVLNAAENKVISPINKKLSLRRPVDTAFFSPLGRERKVKVFELSRGAEFPLELEFFSQAEVEAFEVWINRHGKLLLQAPWGEQWYVELDGPFTRHNYNYPDYFTGDLTFVEVDAP